MTTQWQSEELRPITHFSQEKQGKCVPCGVFFMWHRDDGQTLRGACCPDCGTPLSRTVWTAMRTLKFRRIKSPKYQQATEV